MSLESLYDCTIFKDVFDEEKDLFGDDSFEFFLSDSKEIDD